MNKRQLAEAVMEVDELEQLLVFKNKLSKVVHDMPDLPLQHIPPSVDVKVTLHGWNDVTFNLDSTLVFQLVNGKIKDLIESLTSKGVKL
jgi:hypothetical protein